MIQDTKASVLKEAKMEQQECNGCSLPLLLRGVAGTKDEQNSYEENLFNNDTPVNVRMVVNMVRSNATDDVVKANDDECVVLTATTMLLIKMRIGFIIAR